MKGDDLASNIAQKITAKGNPTETFNTLFGPSSSTGLQRGGGGENIDKVNQIINNLFLISILYNSHLIVQLMTLMSYRIQFDAFWEEFAKGSVGIQKEDFIKLFFIDISNIPEVYKKIQFTLTTINEEALRDTIIYKQYVENASETRVIFIANIIGKLYEYNDRNKSNIDVFFANNIIAVELGNLTLQINKKYKDLFLVQKQKSSSQYDLLVSQKQLLNQEYQKLFNDSSKVYTYVKIRHDGKINRRFSFHKLEKDNETLTVDYYNVDGQIEPAKEEGGQAEVARELASLQQNGPAQKHLFGPFNKIFTNKTETKDMAEEIFNQLRPKLDRQEEVFFIGYGTSGSGKTASLIFLQVGTTKTPGVLQHFANKLLEIYNYDTLQITMFDFYVYFANTSTSASDFHSHFTQVKPIEIDGLSVIKFKKSVMAGGTMEWIQDTQGEPKQLGIFINEGFDKREVEPTSNNVDSSRSHVLVFLKFQKRDGTTQLVCVGDLAGVENVLDCPSVMKKMNQAYTLASKHRNKNIPLDTYVPDQIKDRVLEKFLNLKTELKTDADGKPIPLIDKDGYPIKDQFEYGIKGDILSSSFNVAKIGGAQYEVKTSIKELTDREIVSAESKRHFPDGNPVSGDYSYEKCSAIKDIENLDFYIKYDESKSVEDNIKLLESQLPPDSSGGDERIKIFNDIKSALTSLKPNKNDNPEYTTPKIFSNAIQEYLVQINDAKLKELPKTKAIIEILKMFGFKAPDIIGIPKGSFNDPNKSTSKPAASSKTAASKSGTKTDNNIDVVRMTNTVFDNFLWQSKDKGIMNPKITGMENIYQKEFDVQNALTAKKSLEIKCQILRIMKINYNCGLRRMEGYMINRSLADMRIDIKNLVTISTNLAKYKQNLQYLRRAAEQIGILDGLSGNLLQKFITDNTSIILPLVIDNNVNPYCRNTNMGVIDPYKNFYKKLENKKFDPIGILMRTIMQQGYNLENLNFVIFTVVHVSQKTFAGSIVNNPPPIPFIPILNLKSVILTNKIGKIKTELVKLIDVMKKFKFYNGFVINLLSNRGNIKTIENTNFELLSEQESTQVAMELLSKIESNNSATTLGTLYATDILKNNAEHPFSCLVNDTQEREAFSKFNRDFPLVKTVEIDKQKIVPMQKYLKYKNKYLALKEKLRNRQ